MYQQDVGVWEGYTLKEHTLMVMQQFEKYFGDKDLPADVDKNILRLILALHDIGKPEAASKGRTYLQHQYTIRHVKSLFEVSGIDEKHTKLALTLVSGDPIGKYLKGNSLTREVNITQTREVIGKMAKEANMPVDKFFELLCIYYKVDAGSYTENAGGKKSLDNLFDFDEVNHQLRFSPYIQSKIDALGFDSISGY